MQSLRTFKKSLEMVADENHFLFSRNELKIFLAGKNEANVNMILSRAVKDGFLERVCKGIFILAKVQFNASLVLPLVASKMRSGSLNYISMESVLAEKSVISQQLMNWLVVVTGGRSGVIGCGRFGSVEFIHTERPIGKVAQHLSVDGETAMLKADVFLAYRDMVLAHRKTLGLVDRSMMGEYVHE